MRNVKDEYYRNEKDGYTFVVAYCNDKKDFWKKLRKSEVFKQMTDDEQNTIFTWFCDNTFVEETKEILRKYGLDDNLPEEPTEEVVHES